MPLAIEIGQIEAIFRHPVKSMRGERREDTKGEAPPTHVLTPDGEEMPVFGEALAAEVTTERFLQVMGLGSLAELPSGGAVST